ncbi:MAG: hypothetical protein JXB05_14915 [Myxococcaceae bacterium]|nr:hypothetical protein [Myxococcaceae bacterium]
MILSLLSVTLLASAPTMPPPSCQTVNRQTACGYSCATSLSGVRCASTPYGTCRMFHGEVYCFDPPFSSIHHPPDEGLRPECKAVGGDAACGFNCLVAKGKVACARTPYGVCREHYGQLKCWDPPESVIHEYGSQMPRPTCLTASTSIECGYDCKADRAEVKCAVTPGGRCEKRDSELICFDPPLLSHCSHSQPPDPNEVRKPKSQRQEEKPAETRQTEH